MADGQDFYDVLGVSRNASQEDIQQAYRKLAREYHPDLNKDPGAEERFKDVSEAYSVLSDPDTRKRYDAFGPSFRQVPDDVDPDTWRRATSGAGRAQGPGFDSGFGGGVDLDDLLGGLFGGRTRGFGRFPGADHEAEVDVTVEEAFRGGQRSVSLGTRTLDVTIPAGVTDGTRIRLAGQGGQGSGGAPPGDLYLVVRIAPHRRYRVDGRDIYMDLPLSPWEAALGTSVAVDLPDGEAKVNVPGGTSSGRRLRLRGRGLPNPRGTPGDLYAVAVIRVPHSLSHSERQLFEQLAAESRFDPRRQR